MSESMYSVQFIFESQNSLKAKATSKYVIYLL